MKYYVVVKMEKSLHLRGPFKSRKSRDDDVHRVSSFFVKGASRKSNNIFWLNVSSIGEATIGFFLPDPIKGR